MLNSAFDAFGDASLDFYPEALRAEIDALNAVVYENVNNGVYKAGFAPSQEAYEEAFRALFNTLDELDAAARRAALPARRPADRGRLAAVHDAGPLRRRLLRHFKCNRRRIADYPNLSGYLRDLFQMPGVKDTVDFEHIKQHYYYSHDRINPTRIVPLGPLLILDAPHDRDRFRGTGIPHALSAPTSRRRAARRRAPRGAAPASPASCPRAARRAERARRPTISRFGSFRRRSLLPVAADEERHVIARGRRARCGRCRRARRRR